MPEKWIGRAITKAFCGKQLRDVGGTQMRAIAGGKNFRKMRTLVHVETRFVRSLTALSKVAHEGFLRRRPPRERPPREPEPDPRDCDGADRRRSVRVERLISTIMPIASSHDGMLL